MEFCVRASADALFYCDEFEGILQSEVDPRRKAFLEFVSVQSFVAVSLANAVPQPVEGFVVADE